MAETVLSICNKGLAHLGAYSITDTDPLVDTSVEAVKCDLFYAPARDYVLSQYPWNFAKKRATLLEMEVDTDDDLLSIVKEDTFIWTASSLGTSEYYLSVVGGGDPIVAEPTVVYEDDAAMTGAAVGSLTAGQWDYGDNDSLGYDTVYVRLTDSTDPDTKDDGYLQIPYVIKTEYSYIYRYPTDCLTALEIYRAVESSPPVQFEVIASPDADSKLIVLNENPTDLVYTQQITNTALFDAAFVMSLSDYLAALLAMPITRNRTLASDMKNQYLFNLPKTQTRDANEGRDDTEQSNVFTDSRL